jgi:DNA helicase-2/ATP-dependent DNA helicase PcrA
MLPLDDFMPLVRAAIPRFQQQAPNPSQAACIHHDPAAPLAIFAGPGSGKTTVLVLRALRMVLVDGLLPEQVVLTTFTRKAADELRSRLIEWGSLLCAHLDTHGTPAQRQRLTSIDINRFVTGTLDSICEDVLTTLRAPDDPAPVLVEGFVGNALLMFEGLFATQAHQSQALKDYLSDFTFEGDPPANFGELLRLSRTVIDRLVHDRVDPAAFAAAAPHTQGRMDLFRAMGSYREYMKREHQLDFALLEERFLERLSHGRLERFTENLRALLVDEYQDTNPLQEAIYFELLRRTGAFLTVVGDDDQSLYRFRGATVELFRDFTSRMSTALPHLPAPCMKYLTENYRSTPEIIQFVNAFIQADPGFAPARVFPPKPIIQAQRPSGGIPVLGLFREDTTRLADDLSQFLLTVFRGGGRIRTADGGELELRGAPDGGAFGDCVFLAHSVNELTRPYRGQPSKARLPRLLREHLMPHGVPVFNPRGRELRDIPIVQHLLGTLLECIDPGGHQQAELKKLTLDARNFLDRWRTAARLFIANNPAPRQPRTLDEFVKAWQARRPQGTPDWPTEWPVLELCFKLLAWIPQFQNDPEGQVYLEAISRCISQASTFSSFRSTLLFRDGALEKKSVQAAIQDILVPIAESAVEIDEEIMPHVPRGWLPLMTIHQAKGLEFPLVMVDVGSDFKTDHHKTRFRRFPEHPNATQRLEEDLAPLSEIGPLRRSRDPLARTFDDLVRLYYVAFSRPQSVLLLVGLENCIKYTTTVKNVATGWRSDGQWPWRVPHAGKKPPTLVNNPPLVLL